MILPGSFSLVELKTGQKILRQKAKTNCNNPYTYCRGIALGTTSGVRETRVDVRRRTAARAPRR